MKKIVLAIIAGASLCALSACSTYTEATGTNGTTVKRVAIAPGTSITTPNGCINSAGGSCEQQSTTAETE
ncbi:hypothetical protein QNN88_01865 [Citrobacter sp. ANG330]|uniref:hypothetical protein n=1 Tax=Citrobacter sp. ANG330 TaxID=3048142 RepID=UPI0039C19996